MENLCVDVIDKYIIPPGLNKNHKESLFKTHPRVIERNATLQVKGLVLVKVQVVTLARIIKKEVMPLGKVSS